MLRKLSIVDIVALLGTTMVGVTIALASGGGNSTKAKVIQLKERSTDFAYVASAPDGPLGDYLVFHADLFDQQGRKVGTEGGRACSRVRPVRLTARSRCPSPEETSRARD